MWVVVSVMSPARLQSHSPKVHPTSLCFCGASPPPLFCFYSSEIGKLVFHMWKAENLQCMVQQLEEKMLVQRAARWSSQNTRWMCVKTCLRTWTATLQDRKGERGQDLLVVFLRTPVASRWVGWKNQPHTQKTRHTKKKTKQPQKSENLQSLSWVWWNKSLCGGGSVQCCSGSSAAATPVSVSVCGEEHLRWAQQWLSGREEVRLLSLA